MAHGGWQFVDSEGADDVPDLLASDSSRPFLKMTVYRDLPEATWGPPQADGLRRHVAQAIDVEMVLDDDGRPVLLALRARYGGLIPSELQRLPWANLIARADAMARVWDRIERAPTEAEQERIADEVSGQLDALNEALDEGRRPPKPPKISRRPGRSGHPDEHYRAVATRYIQLRASGVTSPTLTIARERGYSRDTVAGWVREARSRGYLPPARPGRAG
ncbi:MAG: hypothetical protein M0010_06145 [Actinomycetota bacterium]|nr:hypothetical protein [Actinomycetota bacterium]